MKMYMLKLKAGQFKIPVTITEEGSRLFFAFPFNKELMAEVKAMKGAKWHGFDEKNPRKAWSVTNCLRNRFQLTYLAGGNPYHVYDTPLDVENVIPKRPEVKSHQREFIAHLLRRKKCVLAARMGTGKTLSAIEAMEMTGGIDYAWIGPRSALAAVRLEFKKWNSKLKPLFYTYDTMRSMIQRDEFHIPHDGVIFDEAQKIKNPTSQRSVAAAELVEQMLARNPDALVVLMSGTPAPKSPIDWWHICEVACPGFLREGDVNKFRNRLSLVEDKQSITGGVYPSFITWWDDERKCKICGKLPEDHDGVCEELTNVSGGHTYQKSVNEIELLYKRMQGLVLVKFKEDCLDLPDMQYRKIIVKPSKSILRAANLIKDTAPRAVTAMMLQRELSDGFQYEDKVDGKTECNLCLGSKTTKEWYDPEHPDEYPSQEAVDAGRVQFRMVPCTKCKGTGEMDRIVRGVVEIPCPKEQVFLDLLEEHDEIARFVTYAGFQASVDRLVRAALNYGWDVIRADGRGWACFNKSGPVPLSPEQMLEMFQATQVDNQVVFIGQAGAAGLGITLTASPSVFFYSNSFNNEDRQQAKDRIHRMGMDVNRGATCIDVVHLPIDQYILDNLELKAELEEITMGKFREDLDRLEALMEKEEDTYVLT